MRTFIKIQCALILLMSFNLTVAQSDIQIVRIDFQNSEGFTRQLAIGFLEDNSATDGVDYGYDAPYIDDLEDDLNWMIDDNRYIIQGVGAFSVDKYYPLGLFLSNSGEISISLSTIENFENEIEVYVYDLELNEYALLSEVDLTQNIDEGDYINRFFITFSNTVHYEISANYLLSTNDNIKDQIKVRYSKDSNELVFEGLNSGQTHHFQLYDILGKKVLQEKLNKNMNINTSKISSGVYVVKIESFSLKYTTKVYITN